LIIAFLLGLFAIRTETTTALLVIRNDLQRGSAEGTQTERVRLHGGLTHIHVMRERY
jgi:hypothetical protein